MCTWGPVGRLHMQPVEARAVGWLYKNQPSDQPTGRSNRQVITTGALLMELAAVFVLGATFVVYDYCESRSVI